MTVTVAVVSSGIEWRLFRVVGLGLRNGSCVLVVSRI
jgi:hypothetical protein